MPAYRDDVEAAEARLRKLEANPPPARPGPPAVRPLRVLGVLVLAVCAFGGGVASAWKRLRDAPTVVLHAEAPLQPAGPAGDPHRTWYEPDPRLVAEPGPLLTTDKIVGMAWGDSSLYVVAYDRATLRAEWLAGPFPSRREATKLRHRLILRDDKLVHFDATGLTHVLDLASGKVLGESRAIPPGVNGSCLTGDGTRRIIASYGKGGMQLYGTSWGMSPNEAMLFDPVTLVATAAPLTGVCLRSDPCADGCGDLLSVARKPAGLDFQPRRMWQTPAGRIAVGPAPDGTAAAQEVRVAGLEADGSARWQLTGAAHHHTLIAKHEPLGASTPEHFVFGYAGEDGFHLVGLEPETGAERWEVVAFPDERAVPYLVADGRDLFVPGGDEMFVYDLATGTRRGQLEAP